MAHASPPGLDLTRTIWTRDMVRRLLIRAGKWAVETGGPVGPALFKPTMPNYVPTGADRSDPVDAPRERRTLRTHPTRVSLYEDALEWSGRYVVPTMPGPARVLRTYLRCKVLKGVTFEAAIDRKRWTRPTAYRSLNTALDMIVDGLNRDRIPYVEE
jgi:hypothetical protein